MDPIKILRRAWYILWSYRALWVFGLILALAGAGSSSGNANNSVQYQRDQGSYQTPLPQDMREAFREFTTQIQRLFREGVPEAGLAGQDLTALLWTIAAFLLFMLILGVVIAIARYVSETAVIRMVDEYEGTGSKMTIRQGFRIGWSRTAWRLFLINLIVNLPAILLVTLLLIAGIIIYRTVVNGNQTLATVSIIGMIGLVFLAIFVGVILTILLHLLRQFFWRVCALEDAGVTESLRRGFAMVRENWKNVGLMWLVMIGLGIAWAIVSIIAAIITLPLVIITGIIAAAVVAIPALLLVGLFSLFLSGPLPWVAGILFVLPLFFVIAFSPWMLLGSWQTIYSSSVWTLTYREIKALPALPVEPKLEPAGD